MSAAAPDAVYEWQPRSPTDLALTEKRDVVRLGRSAVVGVIADAAVMVADPDVSNPIALRSPISRAGRISA